jgi:hypothetical protein
MAKMRKWEQQLREQYAGDKVWSHPRAAVLGDSMRETYGRAYGIELCAANLLNLVVQDERKRRSRRCADA